MNRKECGRIDVVKDREKNLDAVIKRYLVNVKVKQIMSKKLIIELTEDEQLYQS
jgi:hypothetical protein